MKQEVYRFGRCELRPARRELRVNGHPRPLERRPFDLLVYLVRHRERVVSKDELLNQLWADDAVTVGVVARAVMKARQAIDDSDPAYRIIKTVARVGYRFTASLSQQPAAADVPMEKLDWAMLMTAQRGAVLPGTVGVADPFASRALMRALQAMGEQKWRVASNLLQVVLDIEPGNTAVQLELLRALAPQGDDDALAFAQRLLRRAREAGDDALAAAVHQAIGPTTLNKG